jgi:farnesyl-diphosphate farnesyltransferase
MDLRKDALATLEATSRTFFIPISRLPAGLQEAVASGYLCMRAIDEVEDHPDLDNATKAQVLRRMSLALQGFPATTGPDDWTDGNAELMQALPEVSLRLHDWAALAPSPIAGRICDATAAMADRMAHWAEVNWTINSEADLDRYTFSVAGAVGLLLSDLWAWYDGTQTDRTEAVGFGRGLQVVNILRNHQEDLVRGADFYPHGWTDAQMHEYAQRNLRLAEAYTSALKPGPVKEFCQLPLLLAQGTLEALMKGKEKLSRVQVMLLVQKALQQAAV